MKNKLFSIATILIVIFLSSCGGTPTEIPTQEPTATISEDLPEVTPTSEPIKYDEVTLKINSSPLTSFAPIFIAEAEGYFAEFGIKLENLTFNKSTDAVPLIITGDLDLYAGSINAGILNVLRQEANIKVVADRGHITPDDTCTYQGLLVRKDLYDSGEVKSAADLAGLTIVSTSSGISGYLLSSYLAPAGLTLDDVVLTDLPTAGYLDAMANKSVAAILVPELHLSRILNAGNAVILVGGEDAIAPMQLGFMSFGKNLLVDHPDLGARFMAGYLKGVQQYNLGKTERNVQIMADATGETIETLQAACWISINSDGFIDFSGIDGFQQWSIAQEQLEAPVTEDQFWDSSFLAAAEALINP